jgi:cobyrinic acid a,c-diamide synthase
MKTNLQPPTPNPIVRIGIIRDSAFQFYYPENFEELQKRGAELVEISAMQERELPDIDALYIGGGFPETNAIALAKNTAFKKSLRNAVEEGIPVYAECGGLMYLGALSWAAEISWPEYCPPFASRKSRRRMVMILNNRGKPVLSGGNNIERPRIPLFKGN